MKATGHSTRRFSKLDPKSAARAVCLALAFGLSAPSGSAILGAKSVAAADDPDLAGIRALIEDRDYERALKRLTDRQRRNAKDIETYLLLAHVYVETGAGIAAEATVERARRLGADYKATAVLFAKSLLVQGKYSEALGALRGVTVPAEMQEAALVIMGDANFAEKRFADARHSYELALKANSGNFQAYLGLARLALSSGDLAAAAELADKAHENAPGNTMVQYTRGLIARYQGDLEHAEEYFLDALKLYPGNVLVNLELAAIRINQKKFEEAETYLDAVYAVSPKHPMALYLSGAILASRGQYQEADAILLRAQEVTNNYLPAAYVRGLVAYQVGNYALADNLLSKVVAARPGNRPARLALAGTYMRQQRPSAAFALLKPLLDAGTKDENVIAIMAVAAMASGQVEEGKALYERLQTSAENANEDAILSGLAAKIALATFIEGDTSAAVSTLSSAVTGDAKDLRDLGILGGMQLQIGDYDGAEVTIQTILKAVPERALGYNMRGTLEHQRGQYAAAIASYSEALKRNPEYYTALRNRALAYLRLGNGSSAEDDLKRLLKRQPEDVRAKAALGRALLLGGKPAEAVDYFRVATMAIPGSVDVRADYAEALAGAGNTSQAISVARDATVMGADRPDILRKMGLLLLDLKQPMLASRPLSRYVAFKPDDGEAHLLHGRALLAAGLFTGARMSFERAGKAESNRPDSAVLTWYLFDAATRAARYDAARVILPDLVDDKRPDDVRASIVGHFLLETGEYKAATEAFEVALKNQPSGDVAIGLANALSALGQTGEAVTALKKFVGQYPGDRQARMELGLRLERDGEVEAAAEQYEQVLRSGIADADVAARLAQAYLRLGRSASVQLAERAYLIKPEDPFILDTYGWVVLQANRDAKRAVDLLERATRRAPSSATYKYHLGMAYLALYRKDDARRLLQQALSLDPDFADAEAARYQLQLMR